MIIYDCTQTIGFIHNESIHQSISRGESWRYQGPYHSNGDLRGQARITRCRACSALSVTKKRRQSPGDSSWSRRHATQVRVQGGTGGGQRVRTKARVWAGRHGSCANTAPAQSGAQRERGRRGKLRAQTLSRERTRRQGDASENTRGLRECRRGAEGSERDGWGGARGGGGRGHELLCEIGDPGCGRGREAGVRESEGFRDCGGGEGGGGE
jgi:hypothetical protein